jgi:dephospho-CoA kinase
MTRPYRVGMTGGIGSGKSVVAAMFAGLGTPVIDADIVSRELTGKPGTVLQKIVDVFGRDILDASTGRLDRGLLRARVFSDNDARHVLEEILHPQIYETMECMYRDIDAPYCIFCIPLLLETDACSKFDRILVIDCPLSMQIERTSERDSISRLTVENIIKTQVSRETRLNAADDIILNDSNLENLQARVIALHNMYLKLVKDHDIM